MKRDFLETELDKFKVEDKELVKKVVDSIMAEYGKAVKKNTEELEKTTTEKDTLKNQLEEANKTIDGFKNIDVESKDKAIQEWKEKYEKLANESNEKIEKITYDNKVNELINTLQFQSESSKKGFISDLKSKELKLDGDSLLGWTEFVENYKKNDPQTFKQEQKKEEPKIIASTGGSHNGSQPTSSYVDLRGALKEQYGK